MQSIQSKAQANAHWKGYDFFHSELYSVNDFDDCRQLFPEIKARENPTTDGPEEIPKAKLKTFSKKKLTPQYEISFEKEFMKEHRAAFSKHYQNYIESIKAGLTEQNIQTTPVCIFNSKSTCLNQSAFDILKTESTNLISQEKNQFAKDLQHQEQLREFLDFVAQQCQPEMAAGFMAVAHRVWMNYVPMQTREPKAQKLVQLGQKLADGVVKEQLQRHFRHYLQETSELNSEFLTLTKVFCTTALLTINGYFENPYYEDGQLHSFKRPWSCEVSSDEEESFDSWQSIISCKKRKGSA